MPLTLICALHYNSPIATYRYQIEPETGSGIANDRVSMHISFRLAGSTLKLGDVEKALPEFENPEPKGQHDDSRNISAK